MNLKDALNLFKQPEFKFKLNNRAARYLQDYLNHHNVKSSRMVC